MKTQAVSSHTPAPWSINESRDDAWEILGPDSDQVYTICELGYTGGNAEANAYLIMVAPDMLAELKRIVDGWGQVEKNVRRLTPWELERRHFANQIIAKAGGRIA